jgi:glucosamine-6-phosphate deaminase
MRLRDSAMVVKIFPDRTSLGRDAAEHAAATIKGAIAKRGAARIVIASGMSQVDFFEALIRMPIDWSKVELFHLDEYIGLPPTHPGSLRKMISEHFIQKVGITNCHLIAGETKNPAAVANAIGKELASAPVDVAFLGIGENAHLAFNDPPADFETEEPYIIVNLDEACRRQQVGEGWFAEFSQVPKQAISMSVRQILKAQELLIVVPERRKAAAVNACLEGEITPNIPASILRTHPNATLYLDKDSASLLEPQLQNSGSRELPDS